MTPAQRWIRDRSYHHADFPARRLRAERAETIAAVLPAREVASTIGGIVGSLLGLRDAGVLDQVLVVDAASQDGTAEVAERAGATVVQEAGLLPGFGPVLGKGDAMWRALSVVDSDLVCFLDADTEGFGDHFARGLLGPLICEPGVEFVKAHFRRPFKVPGAPPAPTGGGRVTELTARPLLTLFYPELAGFRQPLAGEVAARRELLERLPWATGYAVEIAMLIDVHREVGLDALAQVDLEVRQNRHQSLEELSGMAHAVLAGTVSRLRRDGRLAATEIPLGPTAPGAEDRGFVERPPMTSVRAAT